MCLAIVASKMRSDEEKEFILQSVRNAWKDNPHGGGLAYSNGDCVIIDKGYMTLESFETATLNALDIFTDSDILIHLRYASVGVISADNCHPFLMGESAFIHNGTIRSLDCGDESITDTELFGIYVSKLPEDFMHWDGYTELIEDFLGYSKVAFIDKYGNSQIYNSYQGTYEGTTWLSNEYYRSDVYRSDKNVMIVPKVSDAKTSYDSQEDQCYCCGSMLETEMEKKEGMCSICMYGAGYDY
jgi:predicted glutamine amidotransferase